ncbi:TPA: korC [Escherichia coli]
MGDFNAHTLLPGEEWTRPENADVRHVLSLIPLTDIQLANRLDVDERTIRKWKSGETSMVFTTWCCLCCLCCLCWLCWLAGLGMLLEEPA